MKTQVSRRRQMCTSSAEADLIATVMLESLSFLAGSTQRAPWPAHGLCWSCSRLGSRCLGVCLPVDSIVKEYVSVWPYVHMHPRHARNTDAHVLMPCLTLDGYKRVH